MLDVVHLRPHVEQRLEGAAGFLEDGTARVREAVLRQISDRQIRGTDDRSRIRLVDRREHLEQRGLAGAIWPAQTDTFAVADLPRHVVEQRAVAETLGQV